MSEVPVSEALAALGGLIFEGEYVVSATDWYLGCEGNEAAKQRLYDLMQSVKTYEHAFHWDRDTHMLVTKRALYNLTWKKAVRP